MSGLIWLTAGLAALAAAGAVPPPVPRRLAPGRGAAAEPVPPAHDGGPPRWRGAVAVLVALGAAGMVGGPLGLAIGAAAGITAWRLIGKMETAATRKRREQLGMCLPHVVDLMAAALAVGASPSAAVDRVARAVEPPMREELAATVARLRLGVDPARVWSDLGAHPQLGPLGRALARATESGASVADAMHRLAEDQRRSTRAEVESRARSVGVKAAVPLGLCLLPAFVLIGVIPMVAGSVAVFLGR